MIGADELTTAADDFAATALLGGNWQTPLTHLAGAAGVTATILMAYGRDELKAAIPTAGAAEGIEKFLAGERPPCSRLARVRLGVNEGFRLDHDDYTQDEIARDPFYQEFQRPRGMFWNATARLADGLDQWGIELTFKRDIRAGPFNAEERRILNAVLPTLRSGARVARHLFDTSASTLAGFIHLRGDPVFELDCWGRVLRMRGAGAATPPLLVSRHRLIAVDARKQKALDYAISAAVTLPPRAAAVMFPGDQQRTSHLLQILPVRGSARDVFLSTAAVAVLIGYPAPPLATVRDYHILCEAFALTPREAEIAALLGSGANLAEIARQLEIQVGTARNHLKSVFEKTGTRRQAELVALLAHFRP